MNLKTLLKILSDNNCRKVYIKHLSPNDNSKNQVYLGGSFDVLNILPIKEITSHDEGDWKRTRFKTKLDFFWVNEEGKLSPAPEAQLILYPKYPEVRFSGFLKGSKDAPSDLMANRIDQRLLFLGVSDNGQIIGYVVSPESQLSKEFDALSDLSDVGVFKEMTLEGTSIQINSKKQLIKELKRIHQLGWINSKRLDKNKNILPCISSNCGGYTLEAELGITPNGYSEPDYLGWEVKQFAVKDFKKYNSSVVTLMTPEPTHGFYVDSGIESFIRKYGYIDKLGREARLNFGGIHKFGNKQETTNLKLIIEGFDAESKKITNTDGYIGLLDSKENIAASWSFVSLLKHWNTKHANACYVPSLIRKDEMLYPFSKQQYHYGNNIMLGSSTDFSLFLKQIENGTIYYDPGIKLELAIDGKRKQNIKRRSQFRIKSGNLITLYKKNEVVDLSQ
ncbi:MAG: MvaI/BcnI restriction endonuclease family protein [Chitinophagaceae bacterium]|nr:MvaI/BcnI restriction endonuclease family protein [Chitinophagaceae bacterium]